MARTTTLAARLLILTAGALGGASAVAAGPLRITVLYDNTGHRPDCRADWGFSCLIEGTEKTILFDTGTKGDVFAANVGVLRVDLSRIDAIVISHPHGDHTGGLSVALKGRAGLPVFLPFGAGPRPPWRSRCGRPGRASSHRKGRPTSAAMRS